MYTVGSLILKVVTNEFKLFAEHGKQLKRSDKRTAAGHSPGYSNKCAKGAHKRFP